MSQFSKFVSLLTIRIMVLLLSLFGATLEAVASHRLMRHCSFMNSMTSLNALQLAKRGLFDYSQKSWIPISIPNYFRTLHLSSEKCLASGELNGGLASGAVLAVKLAREETSVTPA